MKTIIYQEMPNGAKVLSEKGDEMTILEEITREEFEKKFPETLTHNLINYSPKFLENGIILIRDEWNGEYYDTNSMRYYPVYEQLGEDDFEIIGYEECY